MPSRLGQNFLKNKTVVDKIIKSANLNADDLVLEVGPGKGVLTQELAKVCKKVIAAEIDRNLVEILRDKFKDIKNVEIVEGDILKIDINKILCHSEQSEAESRNLIRSFDSSAADSLKMTYKYKVVANIPYYITSPIIRYFLENEFSPKEMILMVQKEVAQRIVAKPGNHSILSLSVQYYAEPEILFYVPKSDFDPVPEVDSAVIRVTRNVERAVQEERDKFFRVVRAGFCAKRKTLANNLANSFHLEKKEVEEKLKSIGLEPIIRAQELDIEDWKKLAKLNFLIVPPKK